MIEHCTDLWITLLYLLCIVHNTKFDNAVYHRAFSYLHQLLSYSCCHPTLLLRYNSVTTKFYSVAALLTK